MSKIYSEKELRAALWTYNQTGNYAEAGRQLGVPRSTVQNRVIQANRRNIDGAVAPTGEASVPEGFEVSKVSQYYKGPGEKANFWLQMKPLKDTNDAIDAIRDVFREYEGMMVPRDRAPTTSADQLVIYPIADLHLGMLSWRKETGDAYDIDIASRLLREKMMQLMLRTPNSDTGVILNLGDFFHADDNNAMTPAHHNHLDVDSRQQKVLHRGVELMLDCIEMARNKHKRVIVRCLPGNHDPMSAHALTEALYWSYIKCPEVEVDIDPSTFWSMKFGRNMLAAHHGHEVKPHEFPAVMAAYWPEIWGDTDYRYGLMGHIHRKTRIPTDEHGGAMVETFQTIAAKDAWNRGMGHASGRSICAIVYNILGGEEDRPQETVRPGDLT